MAKRSKVADLASPRPTCAPEATTREMEAERRKYRAEDALRTITRAEEIRRDRELMGDVKRVAREQAKTLGQVLGNGKRTGK